MVQDRPHGIATNFFVVSLIEDPRDPDHLSYLMVHLSMIIDLVFSTIYLDNLLQRIRLTVLCFSPHVLEETAHVTYLAMTLGTLALTSTNGRACNPRMRVIQSPLTLDPRRGVVHNYFGVSPRKDPCSHVQGQRLQELLQPYLTRFTPLVLHIISRCVIYYMHPLLVILSCTAFYVLPYIAHEVNVLTISDTLALMRAVLHHFNRVIGLPCRRVIEIIAITMRGMTTRLAILTVFSLVRYYSVGNVNGKSATNARRRQVLPPLLVRLLLDIIT